MLNIEIGPGKGRLEGSWKTVGPYAADNIDYISRWGEEPLPFADNSVGLIYASHVLEHVWWYNTLAALKEAYRVLIPGGKLELHVPNFEYIVQHYLDNTCGDGWRKHNEEGDYMAWVNGRVFTYGGPGNTHRAAFDNRSLTKHLTDAGFYTILSGAPIRGANHGPMDLAMTALKKEN